MLRVDGFGLWYSYHRLGFEEGLLEIRRAGSRFFRAVRKSWTDACDFLGRAPIPKSQLRANHICANPARPDMCGNVFMASVLFSAIRVESGSPGESADLRDSAGPPRPRNHGHLPHAPYIALSNQGCGWVGSYLAARLLHAVRVYGCINTISLAAIRIGKRPPVGRAD